MFRVAIEQHRAQRRHEHHLVGVANDAVGQFDAFQQMAMARAERQRAAVGRIDVQPHFVPAANLGDVGQWIKRADRRRARGGGNGDDRDAARSQARLSVSSSRFGSMRRRSSSAAETI